MSTVTHAPAVAKASSHATQTFKLLLKREFWENKGGFFWAPLISGAIFLFFQLIGGGVMQNAIMRSGNGRNMININGHEVPIKDADWGALMAQASAADLAQWRDALTGMTMMSATWPVMVFGFVVFFYFINALYEERRDKSVLFWKSMPVSDTQTVLSKVVTGLVVAPVIAGAASLLVMLASMLMFAGFLAFNGVNPFVVYFANLDYLSIFGALLLWIPVYALWALPTAGWLLLVSAWSKRVPFLWAVGVPVFVGMLISWFDLLGRFDIADNWFWKNVVFRVLLSAFPGTHVLPLVQDGNLDPAHHGLRDVVLKLSATELLASPVLWIGAIAGIAMIVVAIRLRRWRDEG